MITVTRTFAPFSNVASRQAHVIGGDNREELEQQSLEPNALARRLPPGKRPQSLHCPGTGVKARGPVDEAGAQIGGGWGRPKELSRVLVPDEHGRVGAEQVAQSRVLAEARQEGIKRVRSIRHMRSRPFSRKSQRSRTSRPLWATRMLGCAPKAFYFVITLMGRDGFDFASHNVILHCTTTSHTGATRYGQNQTQLRNSDRNARFCRKERRAGPQGNRRFHGRGPEDSRHFRRFGDHRAFQRQGRDPQDPLAMPSRTSRQRSTSPRRWSAPKTCRKPCRSRASS